MADNDLVFRALPADGPPTILVFGEPDEVASGAAYATGNIALPAFMVAGTVSATRPPMATAAGNIGLPSFIVSGAVSYDSATERPLVGKVSAGWQVAAQVQASASLAHQVAADLLAGSPSGWGEAVLLGGASLPSWQSALQLRNAASAHHQDARSIGAAAALRFQEAQRLQANASTGWQEAARVSGSGWRLRYQDVNRLQASRHARWQEATRHQARHRERVRLSSRFERGAVVRWQDFMRPPPGKSVTTPPVIDPCYVPSTTLVFQGKPAATNTLIFICERHAPPSSGQTIVVPIRRAYLVQNNLSLVRFDTGAVIPASGFAMSLDADSWTQQWSATLPAAALSLIAANSNGDPVDVLATINGADYRLTAEGYRRDRRFGSAQVRVQGRGRAAILDAPYAPTLNHSSPSLRSVAQLMELALTLNGVGIGWGIDFGLTHWPVPGGTWDFQGTFIAAVLDIANAAGAIVQPHATDATLRILPRYPAAPWHWDTLTPDFVLPADAISVEGVEWVTRPDYNRIFVAGTNAAGVRGQITRGGTAGDNDAPMVTHALMTHADGVTQRGIAELSNTGRQANVDLTLQVLPETGIILPGSMVSYDDGEEVRLGLVRSTAVSWARPTLRQALGLETHVEEV